MFEQIKTQNRLLIQIKQCLKKSIKSFPQIAKVFHTNYQFTHNSLIVSILRPFCRLNTLWTSDNRKFNRIILN